MARIKKKYQAVIVGGGLSGLLSAHIFKSKAKDFLIVDPTDKLGGRLSHWQSQSGESLPSNLNLYSFNDPQNQELFSWFEKQLDTRLVDGSLNVQTLHFKEGKFKPLSGFGQKTSEALEDYNHFCFDNEKARLTQLPQNWIDRLMNEIDENQFVINSEVTEVEVEEGRAQALSLNGKTRIEFEQLIWASPLPHLLKVLPPQVFTAADIKKLKRPQAFDAVTLNLFHPNYENKELTNKENPEEDTALNQAWSILSNPSLYCLYGSQDEFEPVLGSLSQKSSCWTTLVPAEKALDHEFVTKAIKNMKKQIKRPFPELFDSEIEERISLSEAAYGHIPLKENESGHLKSVANLFCVSSLTSPAHGLLGTLDRVRLLEKSLIN